MAATKVAKRAPKKDVKAGKQALPFQRGQSQFTALPEELYVEKRPGHKYFEPRALDMPTQDEIEFAAEHGVDEAVKVIYQDGRGIITNGRYRHAIATAANVIRAEKGLPPIRLKITKAASHEGTNLGWSLALNNHGNNWGGSAEDPITQAIKIEQYLALGYSKEDASRACKFGQPDDPAAGVRTVSNRLALLKLTQEIQAAIRAKTVTVTKALTWANLSADDQKKAFAAYLNSGKKPGQRSKSTKPSPKRLKQLHDAMPDTGPALQFKVLLQYVMGEVDEETAGDVINCLGKALEAVDKATGETAGE